MCIVHYIEYYKQSHLWTFGKRAGHRYKSGCIQKLERGVGQLLGTGLPTPSVR